MLFRKSMQIALRLGVKGVVFHAGLLSGLNLLLFADRWIEKSKGFLRTLAGEFPNIDIYIENTFEQETYLFEALSKDEEHFFTLDVEKREVCVMFVDIRGFTPMSEKLSPEEVAQILNEFLSEVTNCVFRHSGMLDKFIGDAAMAVFNAPTALADYLFKAVCAAVDIINCGETLGKRLRERYGNTVNFGIGLNCGDAVVGNIGCEIRMDYTAIGDTVNTAARFEAKASGGEILISEELYERLKDRVKTELTRNSKGR